MKQRYAIEDREHPIYKPLGAATMTANKPQKFPRGQKVECNGNKDGTVIGYYSNGMVEVRLWDGNRMVGVVCVDESRVKPLAEF